MKTLIATSLCLMMATPTLAQDVPVLDFVKEYFEPKAMVEKLPKWQIDFKTLGGRQFWGDVRYFHGYRIQHNVITNHYRLIDSADVRKRWGTLQDCEAALLKIAEEQQLGPMQGRAVILVHGIIRSSKSFAKLQKKLEEDGVTVVPFEYPSTQKTMAESAEYLGQVVASLEGIDRIDFVCHSMGGLLVRTHLQQTNEHPDPRLYRMVMIGTPNLGAEMANFMQKNWAYKWIMGPAGQELIQDPDGVIAELPIPHFEFGLIAGARGTPTGWNPLVPGDDDGTVSVASAQLPGAHDFVTVKCLHSFIPEHAEAMEMTIRFLDLGHFRESGERQPVPAQHEDRSSESEP